MAGIFTDKKKRNGSSRYLKYLLDAGRPEEEEETLIQKHNVSLKMNKFFSFVIRSHNRKQWHQVGEREHKFYDPI